MRAPSLQVALALAVAGCTGIDDAGDGDRADEGAVASAACMDLIDDVSGRGLSPGVIAGFSDPVAERILRPGDDCPTTWADALAKLQQTDADGAACGKGLGVRTSLVSERSQLLGAADEYRSVSARACGGRANWELLFAPPTSTRFKDKAASEDVEVIAFRRDSAASNEQGEFQFYALEAAADGSRRWRYYGGSTDMLQGPGDTPAGGRPFVDQERRCAHCHLSGGPVMKELERPWNGWEVAPTTKRTPRYLDMIAQIHGQLGIKGGPMFAEELMNIVKNGTRAWNRRRIADLRKKGELTELLRPLFCTTDVNLAMGSQFQSAAPSGVPTSFLVDSWFKQTSSVPLAADAYAGAIERAGQVVMSEGEAMQRSGQVIQDTLFAMAYPERSFRDVDYVTALVDAKVVSAGFASAVLMVDFTRPVFSDQRCALLDLAAGKKVTGSNPTDKISDLFLDLLAASKKPGAAGLRDSLTTLRAGAKPEPRLIVDLIAPIGRFYDQCTARSEAEPAKFADDMVRLASLRRQQTRPDGELGGRAGQLIEHGETLPFDDLPAPAESLHLDPDDCTLAGSGG